MNILYFIPVYFLPRYAYPALLIPQTELIQDMNDVGQTFIEKSMGNLETNGKNRGDTNESVKKQDNGCRAPGFLPVAALSTYQHNVI